MLDRIAPPQDPAIPLADEARSLGDLFLRRATASPNAIAWKVKRAGVWMPVAWSEFARCAGSVATFLARRGLVPGDKIAVVGGTRPEWCMCDVGGQLAALVSVGAYPTLAPGQLTYLLDHADVRVVFVEGAVEISKLLEIKRDLPHLELCIVWDPNNLEDTLRASEWIRPFEEVLGTMPDHALIEERVRAIDPDETAVLIYTSGTTGPPKGAMISHANALTILRGARFQAFERTDVSLAFLPMAHAAERILGSWGRIDYGIPAAFASSVSAVLEEIKEVRRQRISEYARLKGEGSHYVSGGSIWQVPCEAAIPSATQNELTGRDARDLIKNGVVAVCEGANMPCTRPPVNFWARPRRSAPNMFFGV